MSGVAAPWVLSPLIGLLALRLWAQHRLRGRGAPVVDARGWASVAVWFALFVLTAALVARAALRREVSALQLAVGLGVLSAALALRAGALARLAGLYHEAIAVRRHHPVVRDGVYRYLRHPLHLALVAEVGALSIVAATPLAAATTSAAFAVLLLRNAQEERHLARALGQPYRDYLGGRAWDFVDLFPALRLDIDPHAGRP